MTYNQRCNRLEDMYERKFKRITKESLDESWVKLDNHKWLMPCPSCYTQVEVNLDIPEYVKCPNCRYVVRTND